MRFMFQYPEPHGAERDMVEAGGPPHEVARVAEESGWSGFAFTEHPAPSARWLASGGHQTLDPFVALGNVAAATTTLRLLTYICVAPYRNPLLLAKAAATVDRLSGGRMILGLGTGYLRSEFHALGVDFDERNDLFDEALDVLPLHWRGEPFSYKGRHFDARDIVALPRPVQQPIPIWIGGNSARTRRRVAERGDGWMPLVGPAPMYQTVRTPEIRDVATLAVAIEEIRSAAGERGARIEVMWPYLEPTIYDFESSTERHRRAFSELETAGVGWIMIPGVALTPEETVAFLRRFGDTYIVR
jgi:probable F420-dependent oxidoreductase